MIKRTGRVAARKLTPEKGRGNRLSPEELGVLAKRLAAAWNLAKATEIEERLTRGFYGVPDRL